MAQFKKGDLVYHRPLMMMLAVKWSDAETVQLLRLGYLRMWSMRNA